MDTLLRINAASLRADPSHMRHVPTDLESFHTMFGRLLRREWDESQFDRRTTDET